MKEFFESFEGVCLCRERYRERQSKRDAKMVAITNCWRENHRTKVTEVLHITILCSIKTIFVPLCHLCYPPNGVYSSKSLARINSLIDYYDDYCHTTHKFQQISLPFSTISFSITPFILITFSIEICDLGIHFSVLVFREKLFPFIFVWIFCLFDKRSNSIG